MDSDKQAQDIAYTINHALACTATDFIDPYFGNLTQRFLGKRFSVGCGNPEHRHAHGEHDHHPHGHHHHDSHLKQWWLGEVVGDFGAVPVTIFLQRNFPSLMRSIGTGMESLLGGFFRRGAEKSTRRWAKKNHIDTSDPVYAEHREKIYRYEIDHLPQALVWTVSSIALNLTTQRLTGNHAPLWQLTTGKAVGASISAGLVVGARGLAPATAHRWDQLTSETIFLPATKAVGSLFGVGENAVDMLAKEEADAKWAERLTNAATPEKLR
jgi:hypothetical protein